MRLVNSYKKDRLIEKLPKPSIESHDYSQQKFRFDVSKEPSFKKKQA